MSLIYIEYISRRPEVDIPTFYRLVNQGQEGWDDAYSDDQLLLNLGRTWRLGPEPEYLGVWYSPNAGLERLDAWDEIFRSGAVNHLERPFHQVARIDVAGCYRPLLDPQRTRGAIYYAEFFRAVQGLSAVREHYQARAARHPQQRLVLLAHRIGRLAPEPGGVAVWTAPTLAAVGVLAEELDEPGGPVELVAAGVYHDFSHEIL